MSLLRVFDVMCWMFSLEGEDSPCGPRVPGNWNNQPEVK